LAWLHDQVVGFLHVSAIAVAIAAATVAATRCDHCYVVVGAMVMMIEEEMLCQRLTRSFWRSL
jgi:hypothetical protein